MRKTLEIIVQINIRLCLNYVNDKNKNPTSNYYPLISAQCNVTYDHPHWWMYRLTNTCGFEQIRHKQAE